MSILSLLLVLAGADPDDGLSKKMLPIYVKEAEGYSLAVESAPKQPLELKKEPVFEWTNPIRSTPQQGVVFLWLRNGRPAAVGCIFSQKDPSLPGRRVMHEFHALDREKLLVSRPRGALNEWKPQAGQPLELKKEPVFEWLNPARSAQQGACFLWLRDGRPAALACIFSHPHRVRRKDKEVWSSIPSETNPFSHDPLHLYRIYPDKVVTPEGKLLARIRQTPREEFRGEVIPVEDK
jgi:hypothetical protein